MPLCFGCNVYNLLSNYSWYSTLYESDYFKTKITPFPITDIQQFENVPVFTSISLTLVSDFLPFAVYKTLLFVLMKWACVRT